MNFGFLKDMKSEKKMFILFLAIHLIVWTCIGLIRVIMPTDSVEGIFWATLKDFGTPKHPPLAAWLTYLAYMPFKSDFCVYLLSQTFILFGFIYIYKLAKEFLSENMAMLSVIILEGCWVYSYITGYYGFNPDVVLLFTLPAITYHFHKCATTNKWQDWIILGILVGLSFFNKYQTGLVILAMAIWSVFFRRQVFKNKFFYTAIAIAFLIFLPHLLWLFKYDFFIFNYYDDQLVTQSLLDHIISPLKFLFMQVVLIIGTLLIFAVTKIKFKSCFKPIAKYDEKFWFLIIICFTPLLVHLSMGFFLGSHMYARWNFVFWYLLGIILFYVFPIEDNKKVFDFVTKSSYVAMIIVFLALGGLLTYEKNYRSRYPVATVMNDMQKIAKEEYNMDIKYVGGYAEWTFPLSIYADSHPITIMDTFNHLNIWIDYKDLKKSGALIIDRDYDSTVLYALKSCPYIMLYGYNTENIKPKEYKLLIRNALNMPREYTIHYYIVPPMP